MKIRDFEWLKSDTFDYSISDIISSDDFKKGLFFYFYTFEFPESDDTQEDFHQMFTFWKESRLPDFQNIRNALIAEYSPIENYDRYEDSSDTDAHHKGSKEEISLSGQDSLGRSGAVTRTDNLTESSSGENTSGLYGFNSTDSSPADTGSVKSETKNTGTQETKDSRTDTTTYGKKETHVYSDQGDTVFDKDENTHTAHLHGNIGVTTSQQMITEELKLRNSLFLKRYILDDFASRVLILNEGVR